MNQPPIEIVFYSDAAHRPDVVTLWNSVFGYGTPHNEPGLAIDRKLANDDHLFFVAASKGRAVGTVMAGYDGHRGWIYSLAVTDTFRSRGIGKALMERAEAALSELGCVKINLQIAAGNESVADYYEKLGYAAERRISMGKRLLK